MLFSSTRDAEAERRSTKNSAKIASRQYSRVRRTMTKHSTRSWRILAGQPEAALVSQELPGDLIWTAQRSCAVRLAARDLIWTDAWPVQPSARASLPSLYIMRGPARGGPGPARGGPGPARSGPPTAAPQGRGRGGTRRSVSQEPACSNNSRSPDTIRRPACGGPGPAGAGTPITAPQGCGHGVTRRSVPQELACSHNNRSPGTMCGPACGGPGPAGSGPPITAPQGCGRGVTRRLPPRGDPAPADSNAMSTRCQRPRLL